MHCLRKFVRLKNSKPYTGYGRTQTQKLIDDGVLPKPFPLSPGGRAKGWFEDQLVEYQRKIARAAGLPVDEAEHEGGNSE